MKSFLPIGSVVLLKNAEKRLMICGRVQEDVAKGERYDYAGCYYPEGIIDSKELFLFNNDDIDRLFFIGFQDGEEISFKAMLIEELEKLEKQENGEA